MKTVSESIYSGPSLVIPMADVQHIEKHKSGGLVVVTKHTRWDFERDNWSNNIFVPASESTGFMRSWCGYRSELEANTLADIAPVNTPELRREERRDEGQFGVGA